MQKLKDEKHKNGWYLELLNVAEEDELPDVWVPVGFVKPESTDHKDVLDLANKLVENPAMLGYLSDEEFTMRIRKLENDKTHSVFYRESKSPKWVEGGLAFFDGRYR